MIYINRSKRNQVILIFFNKFSKSYDKIVYPSIQEYAKYNFLSCCTESELREETNFEGSEKTSQLPNCTYDAFECRD